MQSGQAPQGQAGFAGLVTDTADEGLDAPCPTDGRPSRLQTDLARREFALAEMADRLEAANRESDAARSVAERRSAELAVLTDLLEQRRKEVEHLQEDLASWRDRAQEAVIEANRLEAEIGALRASRSWRITSSLRRLERGLGRLRRSLVSGGRESSQGE